MKLTLKIECNTSDICDRLNAMGKFLEANPDHHLAKRMAQHGEVSTCKDFHFRRCLSEDTSLVTLTCEPIGEFAEIMADFEAQVLMS
jgi:hypothetical protein